MATKEKTLTERLSDIQQMLNVPKSHYNSFGKYSFRKCEDILDALKPMMNGLVLTLSDSAKDICGTTVIEANAVITDGKESISVTAFAGVEKAGGMQLAQAFGASSSYARKYALNGLFMIDDSVDSDQTNDHGKSDQTATKPAPKAVVKKVVEPNEKTTFANLVKAGWDKTTIKQGKDKTYFVETSKAYVKLSLEQYELFSTQLSKA